MELSDEVAQFLRIVDREIGLDVFFEAACNYNHRHGLRTDQDILVILSESDEYDLPHSVDTLINWHEAERELDLSSRTFFDLDKKVEEEMDV